MSACVQKGSHVLYTGACKKGDREISWGKQGPRGPRGAPASTPRYAHVLYNSGTGTASMVQTHGMGHATVTAQGNGGFCFRHLPFIPQNATASIDWTHGTSEEDIAQISIKSHGTAESCPAGDPVRVETINANTAHEEHSAFYISFN